MTIDWHYTLAWFSAVPVKNTQALISMRGDDARTSRFFGENSECYALAYQSTHMCSAQKSFGTVLAAIVELSG